MMGWFERSAKRNVLERMDDNVSSDLWIHTAEITDSPWRRCPSEGFWPQLAKGGAPEASPSPLIASRAGPDLAILWPLLGNSHVVAKPFSPQITIKTTVEKPGQAVSLRNRGGVVSGVRGW